MAIGRPERKEGLNEKHIRGLGLVVFLSAAVSLGQQLKDPLSISIKTFAMEACVTTPIVCNTLVNGVLDINDCLLSSDNSHVDFWTFQGVAGQVVNIDMTSTAFDTYLVLLNPTPTVVASNDDFGGNTNSHITFTLTSSGTWAIGANTLFGGRFGSYQLGLFCSAGTPAPPPPVATSLFLNNRFRVTASFFANGMVGEGHPITMTTDTGYFWYFSQNNVEVVVKVVDGRSFNNHFWVFAGGLTNVEGTITVSDIVTGAIRLYRNTANTAFQPVQDVSAF